MKVLREIREAKSDIIEIKLPEEFIEKTLEIIVFPLEETKKNRTKKVVGHGLQKKCQNRDI